MIQSVDRAIQILEILEREKLCGVTEIGHQLDINKSTAFRLLATLEAKGFVEKDSLTSKYRLGLGLLRYGNGVLQELEVTKIAKPVLEGLVHSTGESAHLCVLAKDKAVFIQQVRSSGRIHVSAQIGSEEPIYCSAVGKSMAAHLPEEQLEEIIENLQFHSFTPRTITSKEVLLNQLERVRQVGYAVDDEEVYTGVRCVAAPIWNHLGTIEASIGVSGPANRIRLSNIEEYACAVKEAAGEISYRLGYRI